MAEPVSGRAIPGSAARGNARAPWWRRGDRAFALGSRDELFRAVAGRLAGIARERAAAGRGAIHLALSGGTAGAACGALAEEPYRRMIPWERVHFWQVDERWVPPDDPRSNRRALDLALFSRVPAPAGNIHPVDTSLAGPPEAARAYEEALRHAGPAAAAGFPRFDAVVLGIGADGHTASLFPGAGALREATRWATDALGGIPPLPRVTMTLPVLDAAAQAIFVVSGPDKAAILGRILGGDGADLPAARLTLPRGTVSLLADADALSAANSGKRGRPR